MSEFEEEFFKLNVEAQVNNFRDWLVIRFHEMNYFDRINEDPKAFLQLLVDCYAKGINDTCDAVKDIMRLKMRKQ